NEQIVRVIGRNGKNTDFRLGQRLGNGSQHAGKREGQGALDLQQAAVAFGGNPFRNHGVFTNNRKLEGGAEGRQKSGATGPHGNRGPRVQPANRIFFGMDGNGQLVAHQTVTDSRERGPQQGWTTLLRNRSLFEQGSDRGTEQLRLPEGRPLHGDYSFLGVGTSPGPCLVSNGKSRRTQS